MLSLEPRYAHSPSSARLPSRRSAYGSRYSSERSAGKEDWELEFDSPKDCG
jgi:hypothetical protein